MISGIRTKLQKLRSSSRKQMRKQGEVGMEGNNKFEGRNNILFLKKDVDWERIGASAKQSFFK